MDNVIYGPSRFTPEELELFQKGEHFTLYEKLGSMPEEGGVYFAVWAPNAGSLSVTGEFNGWNDKSHFLSKGDSGIFEGLIPDARIGDIYQYSVDGVKKADPFAHKNEEPPRTGSIVTGLDFSWNDDQWLQSHHRKNALSAPMSIYEVHLGSWKRGEDSFFSYKQLANELIAYVKEMGFTHVEFLPVMEHPFYGSWGYQSLGFFAPSRRFGEPVEFMYLIDQLHQNGIGVIFDWVPGHFPADEHGLAKFDGGPLFEYEDEKMAVHPDWGSLIFDYGKGEVRSFLISSACFWLKKYHVDGIRVDAVASMLYLDFSRKEGQWKPNRLGGRENLEAVEFVKKMNQIVAKNFPDVQMIAEESTAWKGVSKPVEEGGLGFTMKWNLGWMHDTLNYMAENPLDRKDHHQKLIFTKHYHHKENYMLCFSHDEVVYEKGSLFEKMPGDDMQKFANLRLLYGYLFTHSGKKLLFMGQEFAQRAEWNHESGLDWHLLEDPLHLGVREWVKDINLLYRNEPALYKWDYVEGGFEWIDYADHEMSMLGLLRTCGEDSAQILSICNFSSDHKTEYRMGVPNLSLWEEVLNSNCEIYGGVGSEKYANLVPEEIPMHDMPYSVLLEVPPLTSIIFREIKS